MNKMLLVWADNNEDYEDNRVTLLGIFPLERLAEAKLMADNAAYVRKSYKRDGAPFAGNSVYVEEWDMVAQSSGAEVYRREKYAEANKAAAEVVSSVDRDYQRELDLIASAKERDKAQRLANRLLALGVDLGD